MMAWWDKEQESTGDRIISRQSEDASLPLDSHPSLLDSLSISDLLTIPASTCTPLPDELSSLLTLSQVSGRTLNHVQSWRAVTAFANRFWLSDATGIPDDLCGEFFALRHAVADQLGLDEEAEQARKSWLEWAVASANEPAIFHARSYAAHSEAERFIDAHPVNAQSERQPSDAEVPELVALTKDILRTEPERKIAYQYALSAAVAGAAAVLARRNDVAEALSAWSAKWAPPRTGADDRRLLEAQVAHSRGDRVAAARICASVAENPLSEPVTSTIEARQMLAYLSLEAGEEHEALRQLLHFVEPALEAGLVVACLRSVRIATALLNANGEAERAKSIGMRALSLSEGMPICPLIMDIQLIAARSLLDTGENLRAMDLAEPVAQWSELTSDMQRTDTAYDIAVAAANRLGKIRELSRLSQEHATYLRRVGDHVGASHALQQAAKALAYHQKIDEATQLSEQARHGIEGDWELAHWQMTNAYILWSHDDVDSFFHTIADASANYARAGDVETAAESLLRGVYCAREIDDERHMRDFAARIHTLLPLEHWGDHPVHGVLSEYLNDSE